MKDMTGLNAIQVLESRSDPVRNSLRRTYQRHLSLHPSQPLIAYVCQQELSSQDPSAPRLICVQHTVTKQVVYSVSLMDVAVQVFAESDPSKWPSACKALGTIQSLAFYDPDTLQWQGMAASHSSKKSHKPWQGLLVQTSNRVIVLNLRRQTQDNQVWPVHASNYSSKKSSSNSNSFCLAHLGESTLGATPSTNALALTPSWLLVGCSDGTLKCYDRDTQQTVKSIKGLGKGDWMVQLHSANAYATICSCNSSLDMASTSSNIKRRMMTVTKKGATYLIDLEIANDGGESALEIKPPLARFVGGWAESAGEGNLEHSLLTYDAQRDWVIWTQPSSSSPTPGSGTGVAVSAPPKVHVWDLKTFQSEFLKAETKGAAAGGFKPDPSLQIQCTGSGTALVEPCHCACTAWGEDMSTLILAAVSPSGSFSIQGAASSARSQLIPATTLLSVNLADLVFRSDGVLDLDDASMSAEDLHTALRAYLRIYTVKSQKLGPTSFELIFSTNLGIIVVQVPLPPITGARDFHFGAGLGSWGKSLLSLRNGHVVYSSLDTLKPNPVGCMAAKNPVEVYTIPPPLHLPGELSKKRPFFAGSHMFIPSPSGSYIACIFHNEWKYEIWHIATLLQKVAQVRGSSTTQPRNACVASGTGIADFAWFGDSDMYALIHISGWEQAALDLSVESSELLGGTKNAALSGGPSPAKTAAPNIPAALKLGANAGRKKSAFGGVFGRKKRRGRSSDSGLADADDEVSEAPSTTSILSTKTAPTVASMPPEVVKGKKRYVELRRLDALESQATELSPTIAAATSSSLGNLAVRGGNRTLPVSLFGGPVLCVACRAEDDTDDEGSAHFYTMKPGDEQERSSSFTTTGPTLPHPNLMMWDDDGRLCAISVDNRVAVYLLDEKEFVLLGSVWIGSPSLAIAPITSLKFLHGVLYACTWDSTHCVFMGSLEGGICHFDSYLLASTSATAFADVIADAEESINVTGTGIRPSPVTLPLVQPVVLGYQGGSVLVSTLRGIFSVPVHHPLLRMGILMASGQLERAAKWIGAFPESEHEDLAQFLERRGHVQLASQCLSNLSLETSFDICMRHGDAARLEELLDTHGARGLRSIDMGRGVAKSVFGRESDAVSFTVCAGAFLLAYGRIDAVRRLASECLRLDEQGKRDALSLGTLLLPIENDAVRLLQRAVDQADSMPDWLMGKYVPAYILNRDRQ